MRPLPLRPAGIVTTLALVAFAAGLSVARAQDIEVLRGNPQIRAERLQMLREEFKEKQRELREMRERAKELKKNKRPGRKVERRPADEDYVGSASLRTGEAAGPFGVSRAAFTPSNTLANNKAADAAGAGQAEQSIVFLGQNGLCAWNDGQGFNLSPQDVQGYGYTTDGGATWTDGGIPPKAGTILTWTSDPVVTVNEKTGEFFYIGLTTNSGTQNGVGVARGHFSGAAFVWDGVSVVASGSNSTMAFDKQWIAADSLTGNVYATWSLFTTTTLNIYFSRSTDGGVTWSTPVIVSRTWEAGGVSGSRPAVGPNGEVYVAYSSIGAVDADSMKVTKSTDGGLTFGPSVVAIANYDNYFTGAPGFNRGRAVTFPAIAVDRSTGPNRGRVYVAVHDAVNFYGDALSSTAAANSKTEVENNGNFANATPFTVGQTIRGTVSSTSDNDNWKFPTVQGQTYVFFVDSVRTTSFKYTLRIYCPNDTVALSRLALSSDGASSSSVNVHALIVWTAPTTGTYYLRMAPAASTGGYRIRTATHTPVASDRARDQRDAFVVASNDGVTWGTPVRVNDDLGLYDNWLPEVAVGCDGNAYAMWFDWRDTPASCFGGSNIYVTRSTNGGATWAANQVATTAATANWTQVLSNIAPNQGDYNGMSGGTQMGLAWADGRLGDSDVYTARVSTGFALGACPENMVVTAGNSVGTVVTLLNQNVLFPNTYGWTLTCDRNWPGLPATGTVSAGALGGTGIPVSFTVPDTAAHNAVVHFCLTATCSGGCAQTCCFDVTVDNIATPALASLASATAEPGRVSLVWQVSEGTAARVFRSTDGVAWAYLGDAAVGGDGRVSFTDTDVVPGTRYAYRLGLTSGGAESYVGQGWVEVPAFTEFAVRGAFPNPAKSGFSVTFSLPSASPATLEVIDLAGRRVVSREVGTLGAGRHTLSLENATRRLPIGVYAIRLTQGSLVATSKVSIVR